jgi:hypothetical protein
MKNAEQWCFSIGKTDERLLVTVFQQREGRMEGCCVSAMGKGKTKQVLDGVVSGIRMMGEWRAGVFWGWERKC